MGGPREVPKWYRNKGGFGHSVALSQYDGNILVVGAPFYNTLVSKHEVVILNLSMVCPYLKVEFIYTSGMDANYTLQQTLNSPSGTLSTTTPRNIEKFPFRVLPRYNRCRS